MWVSRNQNITFHWEHTIFPFCHICSLQTPLFPIILEGKYIDSQSVYFRLLFWENSPKGAGWSSPVVRVLLSLQRMPVQPSGQKHPLFPCWHLPPFMQSSQLKLQSRPKVPSKQTAMGNQLSWLLALHVTKILKSSKIVTSDIFPKKSRKGPLQRDSS